MCVLQEPPTAANADEIVEHFLPAAPGSIVQLELGTTMLVTDCDDGAVILELARRFRRSLFAGIDPSNWNIDQARRNAVRAGIGNVWFEPGDVTTQRFGGIFHQVLSITPEPPTVPLLPLLRGLHASLRRDGTLFFQPSPGTVSHRILDAGFADVRTVMVPGEPARPLFVARR